MKQRVARPALALISVVFALAVAGCSGGSGDSGDSGGSASSDSGGSGTSTSLSKEATGRTHLAQTANLPVQATQADSADLQPALIKKGTVESRADDVAKAQFEVRRVVDRYAGQVTDEQTTTDDAGHPAYTRMVLRVPAGKFDLAMTALKKIGELQAANTSQQDVTAELIDTRTRLQVQERSIRRIATLFGRAESIRDIMSIEAELSRRQADLESLERRAAYLTTQTSRATITVSIDQIPPKKAIVAASDDNGFVSGLKAGWHGLSATAVALATVLGALLPWLIVIAVLGPPAYLLIRVVRRRVSLRRSARTPSAA